LPNLGSIAGLDGTVQVTPYGTTPASCDVANWGPLGSAETIKLDCTTPSGAPVDTYYDVSFAFGGNILGDNWLGSAYLLADSPTTTRYTPANQYNSLGLSNTVKRTATGTYTASLPNEAIGGDPQVTSYASDNRCQVASFTSPVAGGTVKVSVLCFDPSGALVDSAYMLQWAHGH